MIDPLDSYLQADYRDDKDEVSRLKAEADKLLELFATFYQEKAEAWPYELIDGQVHFEGGKPVVLEKPNGDKHGYSFSTNAMILFALAVASGRVASSVLVPAVWLSTKSENEPDGSTRENLRKKILPALARFIKESISELERDQPEHTRLTASDTFGKNDPFTLSWLLNLLAAYGSAAEAAIAEDGKRYKNKVIEIATERTRKVFDYPEGEILMIESPKVGGTAISHAFPLLRFVQLHHFIQQTNPDFTPGTAAMRSALSNRLYTHLSLSNMPDSWFDAAELVFSLEGYLLISPEAADLRLVDQVFSVLGLRQATSPYWRPLRPFKVSPQGLTLLPQSIEIANSLLRICSLLDRGSRSYFSENVALFKQYNRWLMARQYTASNGAFTGWESEHTYPSNRIHLWQTSQVLLFLEHYSAMLERHIARTSFTGARFEVRGPEPLTPPKDHQGPWTGMDQWNQWSQREPMSVLSPDSVYSVYARMRNDFIGPRGADGQRHGLQTSMLLYGPPGTGKSTIAKEIARALAYPMVTITPSDFIASGEASVEARAKSLFVALEEQERLVVLFDEIDQLLLDRESILYDSQGDVFKLLTPGMLTKLDHLSSNERIVYVVATNYFERIDRAIKRPGRIHARYLVLPPCRERREAELTEKVPSWSTLDEADRADILDRTALYTYRELKDFARATARIGKDKQDKELAELLVQICAELPAAISLEAYRARVDNPKDKVIEPPLEEFALLVYLHCEGRESGPDVPWIRGVVRRALNKGTIKDKSVVARLEELVPAG